MMRAADVPTLMILFTQLLLARQKDHTHHVAFLAIDVSMDRALAIAAM